MAAVAAAERAQRARVKRAERAKIALRARVRRRPTLLASRRHAAAAATRVPSPLHVTPSPQRQPRRRRARASRCRSGRHRARATSARQASRARKDRAASSRAASADTSSQPTPRSCRRNPSPIAIARHAVTSEATAPTLSASESLPRWPPPSARNKRAPSEPSAQRSRLELAGGIGRYTASRRHAAAAATRVLSPSRVTPTPQRQPRRRRARARRRRSGRRRARATSARQAPSEPSAQRSRLELAGGIGRHF